MHMYNLGLIKPLGLLNASSTSTIRFMLSWINPMASINNVMFNIKCHISFKWVESIEGKPYQIPSEASTTLLQALHHH